MLSCRRNYLESYDEDTGYVQTYYYEHEEM